MSSFYFDKSREDDVHSLPDGEVFQLSDNEMELPSECQDDGTAYYEAGWYYWCCFPGCLPEGDPIGPFDSEDAALEAARESVEC